ncbi:acyl-CoA dehydrogenase family protein [Rhodocytophaga aerolata]|uniref:Acyl-CoA dehydrogenase family protein n=1 Tax=Rhodocytophaga aerolata TaxID=455078 RepID=A0ABT8QZS1_9BACT|nr:acyl-CoA dehydrogenase family protein [Rhodocytophaga aerolata]MDO1445174.1 acyl-CoA dehydrogenase family protein [Rhodocytophaga aerolata]
MQTHLFNTQRLKEILPQIRNFVKEELYPLEAQFLHNSFRSLEPLLAEKRNAVKKAGLWAPHLPEKDGGMGLTLVEFAQVSEELGRTPIGHYVFNCQAPDIGNMELLHKFGSAEQKEKFLNPLMKGELRSCFSMTEPGFAGSNPVMMSTTAVREENSYVINGHKWFTSSADGARFAIVMAVTNLEQPNPYTRASMILVPTDTPGFIHVRNIRIMGEAGDSYNSHAEIKYENCRVPIENLLGPEGAGFKLAQERLGPGRIHHCMRWIGICERAFDLMCKRAVAREIAPGEFLGNKQTIQAWIAESRASIQAARLMVLHTAYQMEVEGQAAVREEISTIKFFVANVLQTVIDRAIQVHGALGITDDTILAYWYRHERGARIYDGPDEVHKAVVARKILKNYGLESK